MNRLFRSDSPFFMIFSDQTLLSYFKISSKKAFILQKSSLMSVTKKCVRKNNLKYPNP